MALHRHGYDGHRAYAWLDGHLDAVPHLNPYTASGSLNDGGTTGNSDFTVGAVDREGEIGNYFVGAMASLCVYDRCLTAAEMYALAQCR